MRIEAVARQQRRGSRRDVTRFDPPAGTLLKLVADCGHLVVEPRVDRRREVAAAVLFGLDDLEAPDLEHGARARSIRVEVEPLDRRLLLVPHGTLAEERVLLAKRPKEIVLGERLRQPAVRGCAEHVQKAPQPVNLLLILKRDARHDAGVRDGVRDVLHLLKL